MCLSPVLASSRDTSPFSRCDAWVPVDATKSITRFGSEFQSVTAVSFKQGSTVQVFSRVRCEFGTSPSKDRTINGFQRPPRSRGRFGFPIKPSDIIFDFSPVKAEQGIAMIET